MYLYLFEDCSNFVIDLLIDGPFPRTIIVSESILDLLYLLIRFLIIYLKLTINTNAKIKISTHEFIISFFRE